MNAVWVAVAGTLCLLLCALPSCESGELVPGTEVCGSVLAAYSPPSLNKIYVDPVMAQGFQVIDRSRIFSFTSSFFTVAANGSSLESAEIYADAADNGTATVPGLPLANATFSVDNVFYAGPDVFAGTLQSWTFPADDSDGILLEPGYYWLVINQPSSMGWGFNVAGPRDTSKPVVITNMVQNPPYWFTMRTTAMVAFNGCYIVRPSPSPSASPSPSRAPAVMPITANVTAGFDQGQPVVNVSAPITSTPANSGGVSTPTTTTVTASFGGAKVGNTSTSLQDLGFDVQQTNATSPGQSNTYVYKAQLDNATTLEQSYTFHTKQQQANFEGMGFTISPSSLKWSVNLTADGSGSALQSESLTLEYHLAGMVTGGDGASIPATGFLVTGKSDSPSAGMTTYVLPLSTSIAAQLQVFDVALVDGVLVPLQHQVKLLTAPSINSVDSETTATYVLQLTFPPFNNSLYYDPSLGLGVLVGSPGGKGSGGDNGGLVIAVAVAVPLAVLFVVSVVLGGFTFLYWRKKRNATNLRRRLSTFHSSRIENRSTTINNDDDL